MNHRPITELSIEVMAALRSLMRGQLGEFKVVRTRRGIDVMRLTKTRFTITGDKDKES